MSKKNNELLKGMSTEERLNFAEKLVFGIDGTEIDLSSGMHVIKTETDNANPHAEFLMYKINIAKGKMKTAMLWLRKSYNQNYPMALAMMFYEFYRNNTKGISEDDIYKSLKKAVELDNPVAHYLIGIVYEEGLFSYNKNEEKANQHFAKAKELCFSEDFFADYENEFENQKVMMEEFRGIFQRKYMPDLFLNNIDILYDWISKEKENELVKKLWDGMIEDYGKNPEDYNIDIQTECFSENKTAYFIIQLPDSDYKNSKNTAIYIAVAIDMEGKKPTRYFLGELGTGLSYERLVFVAEIKRTADKKGTVSMEHATYGILQESIMFGKIENELEVFIDRVSEIYNN